VPTISLCHAYNYLYHLKGRTGYESRIEDCESLVFTNHRWIYFYPIFFIQIIDNSNRYLRCQLYKIFLLLLWNPSCRYSHSILGTMIRNKQIWIECLLTSYTTSNLTQVSVLCKYRNKLKFSKTKHCRRVIATYSLSCVIYMDRWVTYYLTSKSR